MASRTDPLVLKRGATARKNWMVIRIRAERDVASARGRPRRANDRESLDRSPELAILSRIAALGGPMRKLLGLVTVLALTVAPIAAQAVTLTPQRTKLLVEGPIVAGDAELLEGMIGLQSALGNHIDTIALNSPGGLVREGMAMADVIQAQHLDVVVPEDARCASACFMLFAAGEHMRSARMRGSGSTSRRPRAAGVMMTATAP